MQNLPTVTSTVASARTIDPSLLPRQSPEWYYGFDQPHLRNAAERALKGGFEDKPITVGKRRFGLVFRDLDGPDNPFSVSGFLAEFAVCDRLPDGRLGTERATIYMEARTLPEGAGAAVNHRRQHVRSTLARRCGRVRSIAW